MRYSLASHSVQFATDNEQITKLFGNLQIGGEGNAIGSISASIDATLWSTKTYATGAWVHEKNLSRSGKVTLSISQLAPVVAKLITLCNMFYKDVEDGVDNNSINGLTINIMQGSKQVAICEDCYPTKIPSQDFGESAADQNWEFTSGRITFID